MTVYHFDLSRFYQIIQPHEDSVHLADLMLWNAMFTKVCVSEINVDSKCLQRVHQHSYMHLVGISTPVHVSTCQTQCP